MFGLAPLAGGGLCLAVGLFISTEYESMLTLEDGGTSGGVTDANTLVTAAMVSAHALLVGNTAWDATTETLQEQAIYRVMRWFTSLESRMKGARSWPTTQELSYPRTGVWAYGREIDYNVIPKELKQAIMEGALIEQATPDALQPSQEHNIKRRREKVDTLEEETEYFGPGSVGSVTRPKVMQLIGPFLEQQSTWAAW